MRGKKMTFVATIAIASAAGAFVLVRADDKPKDRKTPEQMWEEMSAPGDEHKGLLTLEGDWKQTVTVYEGGKATESTGTAKYHGILGGRFVVEETKATVSGFPWEWMGVYGFDKQRKVFTASWFDSLDTTTETAEGKFDNDTKTLTLVGKHQNPGTDKLEEFKWIMKWEDKNRTVRITMVEPGKDGKDRKTMEIVQKKQ